MGKDALLWNAMRIYGPSFARGRVGTNRTQRPLGLAARLVGCRGFGVGVEGVRRQG